MEHQAVDGRGCTRDLVVGNLEVWVSDKAWTSCLMTMCDLIDGRSCTRDLVVGNLEVWVSDKAWTSCLMTVCDLFERLKHVNGL